MKAGLFILAILVPVYLFCQENENVSSINEQQAESLENGDETNVEDEDNLQNLEHYLKHPLNLNLAGKEELLALTPLSELQISNLINYRRLFGKLLSIYELQAVPGWNLQTIQKVLPFIHLADAPFAEGISRKWPDGEHKLLLRSARVLEKARGFDKTLDTATRYTGSPYRLLIRYTFNNKNRVQWGVLGDKDPGEPFFAAKQKNGFDFYSFHLFIKGDGFLKAVAVGDYRVNMGQGLLQWQSLAFTKTAEVMAVKRQSPVLAPYRAAGEHQFYRGMGISLQQGHWEATGFFSRRKISANTDVDDLNGQTQVSSFRTSGYHRTAAEQDERNNLRQLTVGASLRWWNTNWHVAANAVNTRLSLPLQKADEPYNLFSLRGRDFANASLDYSRTFRNVHLFGEAALDKGMHKAFLNGLLISMDPRADASLVLRIIDPRYQSLYASAFTENTAPANETGLYTGVSIRPSGQVSINAYADIVRFPWLKYRVDAPSSGRSYLVQFTYKPGKQTEVYARYRCGTSEQNRPGDTYTTSLVERVKRQTWRLHTSTHVSADMVLRNRYELVWFNKNQPGSEQGFLIFTDGLWKPRHRPWSVGLRLLYFETEGYNSRIYAYESDSQSGFSLPAFFDKGYRYYVSVNGLKRSVVKGIDMEYSLRWAQTVYPGKPGLGSGTEAITGNKKTNVRLDLVFRF